MGESNSCQTDRWHDVNNAPSRICCQVCVFVFVFTFVFQIWQSGFTFSLVLRVFLILFYQLRLPLLLLLPTLHYTATYHHFHSIFPGLPLGFVDISEVDRANAFSTTHFTQRTMSSEELASRTFEAAIELPQ